jgi:hypothetical protein
MGERTTGATNEQIAAAKSRYRSRWTQDDTAVAHMIDVTSPYLIPPDHRIVSVTDIKAALSIIERHTSDEPSPLTERLMALLIGGTNGA